MADSRTLPPVESGPSQNVGHIALTRKWLALVVYLCVRIENLPCELGAELILGESGAQREVIAGPPAARRIAPTILELTGRLPARIDDLLACFDRARETSLDRIVERTPFETVARAQSDLVERRNKRIVAVCREKRNAPSLSRVKADTISDYLAGISQGGAELNH